MDRFEKQPAVYIMANRYRGTLYVGVTSSLYLRLCGHEKLLKKWHRDWTFRIIEEMNPDWADLHDQIDADIAIAAASARPSPG